MQLKSSLEFETQYDLLTCARLGLEDYLIPDTITFKVRDRRYIVIWLKYCQYGIKHYIINHNQSIKLRGYYLGQHDQQFKLYIFDNKTP